MASATDGVSTAAYAGDLNGNVWSFDLSDSDSDGALLFAAKDSGDHAQSITAGLLVGKDPKTGYLWLFFGTGRYLTQSELRSEEHTSELQSLMRISYAAFCFTKKIIHHYVYTNTQM